MKMSNELQGKGSIIKREKTHVCRAGIYITNKVVVRGGLVCRGGFGQPKCKYLKACAEENGLKLKRGRK